MERPPAPPEAVLIRLAREAANIRVADAAARAGVSVARWSQIEVGSELRHGAVSLVTGRAGTIARMAHVVGVTPERLEAEGRRADAAEILREIRRQEGVIVPLPAAVIPHPPPGSRDRGSDPFPEMDRSVEARAAAHSREIEGRIAVAAATHPEVPDDGPLQGGWVFPDDPRAAWAWDRLTARGFARWQLAVAATVILADRAGDLGDSGNATTVGLAAHAIVTGR